MRSKIGFYNRTRLFLHRGFSWADQVFNQIFRPEFNPIYKSGTIAVVLMSLVTVTGLVLVFFYRLGEPWESVREMQDQVWFGRWLRSVHRFASDATVAAVVLHMFRMFAQGKSWGPRAFSWITGVFLLLFLFISAWTGFVMVWDTQAQVVAEQGAHIVDSLGLLADPLAGSFSGVTDTPPASFFFLNLFLHVVVPLGMIFGIWIHTSRMARASWFPEKTYLWGMVAIFIVLGIALPAPLGPKANLLTLPSGVPLDRWFNFWLPFADASPSAVFWWWTALFVVLSVVPWVMKPRSESAEAKPAFNDPKICQGCSQCVKDCPYEAIQMVPRMAGPPISETVALVTPELCVSCGLCSASCGPMTMGPPDRKGTHQYQAAKTLVAALGSTQKPGQTLIIGCQNQPETLRRLQEFSGPEETRNVHIYPTECVGAIHMAVVEYLAAHFEKVYLAACPERNCTNKDGHFLLGERLAGRREPMLLGKVSADKIVLHPVGAGEERELWKRISGKTPRGPVRGAVAFAAGLIVVAAIAFAGMGRMGAERDHGFLRLNWRLAGQTEKHCKASNTQALAHMRAPEQCTYTMLPYQLEVKLDGNSLFSEPVRPTGFRHDRPLYVKKDLELPPGSHRLEISFVPENPTATTKRLVFSGNVNIVAGRISLVHISGDQNSLILKEGTL